MAAKAERVFTIVIYYLYDAGLLFEHQAAIMFNSQNKHSWKHSFLLKRNHFEALRRTLSHYYSKSSNQTNHVCEDNHVYVELFFFIKSWAPALWAGWVNRNDSFSFFLLLRQINSMILVH